MSNTNPSNALPLSGEELQLIAERRNKAAVCVSRMVIDGDSDSDDMGGSVSWRTDDVESNIIYEAEHEKQVFDSESYDSEEYKIAEFGGETNRDNDADFCFHAYTDVPRLLATITTQAETIEAQKKEIRRLQLALDNAEKHNEERERKLVETAFDYCYARRMNIGGFPSSRNVPAIIAEVDKEMKRE